MYGLHSLCGLFSGCHFIISFLKASIDVSFLNSWGRIFPIFGSRNEIFSVPQKILLTFGKVNCKLYCSILYYYPCSERKREKEYLGSPARKRCWNLFLAHRIFFFSQKNRNKCFILSVLKLHRFFYKNYINQTSASDS